MNLQEHMQYLAEVNAKLDELHDWIIEVCIKHEI